jgi:hypothetical protein
MISSHTRTRIGACLGRFGVIWGWFWGHLGFIFAHMDTRRRPRRPKTPQEAPRRSQDVILGPLRFQLENRPKRLQENPRGLGSGPGATPQHNYDLIDSKTLKGTNKRCSVCRYCAFLIIIASIMCHLLNKHHIAFDFNISTAWGLIWGPVGGPVWVRLGLLAFLEPSWGDSWPSRRIFLRVGILSDFRVVTGGCLQHLGRPGQNGKM